MDPKALTRKAVDGVRYVQGLLLAIATVTPAVAAYQGDITGVAEGIVTAVTALGTLAALVLEIPKRRSTTPIADPVLPAGVPVKTYQP